MYLYSEMVEVLAWNFYTKKVVSILRGIYKLRVPWDVFILKKKLMYKSAVQLIKVLKSCTS